MDWQENCTKIYIHPKGLALINPFLSKQSPQVSLTHPPPPTGVRFLLIQFFAICNYTHRNILNERYFSCFIYLSNLAWSHHATHFVKSCYPFPYLSLRNDGIILCRLLLLGSLHAHCFFGQDYILLMSKMGIFICLVYFLDLYIWCLTVLQSFPLLFLDFRCSISRETISFILHGLSHFPIGY